MDKADANNAGGIHWNWFSVPIDHLRFFLTPKTTNFIINSGSEFKINWVNVKLKQFTVFTDMVHTTSTGEKFTQFPTSNPFVFIYEDHGLILPRRDANAMEEWEIKSNLTHQGERSACTLKRFISRIPPKMEVDIEDLDLFQTNDWAIKDLKAPINVHRDVNMPWVAVQENLFYDHPHKLGGERKQIAYRFPHISTLTGRL